MAFTAQSVSILNGQDVVDVNSAESIENIKVGDFLQIGSFPLVEIKQAYKNGQGQKFIQLTKAWELTTQSNQPAIVIPTSGEFRAAVKALQDANILVNDNQQALQDYQNNLGTVTFKKSDGTTTTVKTLKQIEADNQAQMNAYHPYPWAMRKVEFEAMRAANNEKYAANGFVHFGKHISTDTYSVNEGLSIRPFSPNNNMILLGRKNSTDRAGNSETQSPYIYVSGVISKLDMDNADGLGGVYSAPVKLPPAEDGTRTYDSATGNSVKHETSTLAFAAETDTNKVVIARVDMWGLKGWLREITDNDPFVYKNGLPQSLATDINGVPTVSDTVNPIEYFAWYKGETTSRGKGVNWKTATEAQRIAIASDPDSNIVFDDATGKFYQWTVLGKSWAGFGNGDWQYIDVQSTATLRFDINSAVNEDDGGYYVGTQNGKYNSKYTGSYQKYKSTSLTGEYLVVCGTVPRLNMGSYHPSHNNLGAGKTGVAGSGYLPWNHTSNDKLISRASCFKPWDGSTWGYAGGDIANGNPSTITTLGTGRPDGRYYDAIYASGEGGVCRDMRYSAWGLTSEDFAEQDLKIKSGEYRGREVLLKTKFIPETVTVGGTATYIAANAGGTISFLTSGSDNPRDTDSSELVNLKSNYWLLAGDNGNSMIIERVSQQTDYVRWPYNNNIAILYGSGDVASEFNSKFPIGTKLWVGAAYSLEISVADEFTHTEVIGDPSIIVLCDDLKDGWVGSWSPIIPNNQTTEVLWTKPILEVPPTGSVLVTDNLGEVWNSGTVTTWINPATNSSNQLVLNLGRIIVASYKTKAKITIPSVVCELYGPISDVNYLFTSMDSLDNRGRLLNYSLTGLISTHAPVATKIGLEIIRLDSLPIVPSTGKFYGSNVAFGELRHSPLSLDAPSNNSPAFKALNYNVAKNQQGFINYAYTQLTYDATAGDWGDDGKIHIADNQTTMPDENGHINLVGMAQCVEPIGWLKNDR